jgi:DNA-binding Lrp family transcriptional regulator
MSKDEIRERLGLPAEKKIENTAAEKTIAAINSLSPLVATKVMETLTNDELRELINLPPAVQSGESPTDMLSQQFSAEDDERDAAVFSEFGMSRSDVSVIKSRRVRFSSDNEAMVDYFAEAVGGIRENVLDLLTKDPLMTQEVIAETLDVDLDVVSTAIDYLEKSGLIEITETKVGDDTTIERKPVNEAKKILKERPAETKSISVMYSYEGPKDDKNRPFCAKMLELDRLYSRADIERISERLGYSVWTRRGGWYTEPKTNKRRPFCRHSWVSNVVVKKK